MRRFSRRGPLIKVRLTEYETSLLEQLIDDFASLLGGDEPQAIVDVDPFVRWQAEFDAPELDSADPVITRLFPDAYPQDAEASQEFRRFTQARQRDDRLEQAELAMSALRDTDGGRHPLQVRAIEVDQWLKLLTALRLALAARLGIERPQDADALDALPEEDPRSLIYRIYEWLAFLSEGILGQAGH
ncbi:MAG: DUF2017 family protein [Propionicimonas sp.]